MFGLVDSPVDLTKLTASIQQSEGTGPTQNGRLLPYHDSLGVLTIGYGRNLQDGISQSEANFLLSNDIAISVQEAQAQPWFAAAEQSEPRLRALCEVLFELGLAKFNGFHNAVSALNRADWATASSEFLNSLWHEQVGKRAERLCAMILTGEDQASR
jgi:lysozyme